MDAMGFVRKNRATIVAGVLLAAMLAGALAAGALMRANADANVAIVHAGDGTTRTLPLDEDARVTVTTDLGTNVIVVEDGAVRMAEADCPRGSCLHERPISLPGEQIICLPHRLWVEIATHAGETGSALDEGAVSWEDDQPGDSTDLIAR